MPIYMNTRSCWGSFRAPPRLRPNCCRHQRRPSVAALDGRPLASRFTDARSMTREVARGGIGIMGSGTSTISTVSWRARGCFLGSRKPQAPAHSRFTQSCNGLRLSASSKDRSGVYRLAAPPIPSDADCALRRTTRSRRGARMCPSGQAPPTWARSKPCRSWCRCAPPTRAPQPQISHPIAPC